jgi:hypothetical protein
MDVQAATPTIPSVTNTLPPAAPAAASSVSGSLPAAASAVAAPAVATPGLTGGSTASSSTPGLALLPPHGGTSASAAPSPAESLPGNLGKLYGAPANTTSVSFQPASGSNEIVTVVTDTQTGKVIVQFPSETLVALAQFFQKLDNTTADNGAVVDKKV